MKVNPILLLGVEAGQECLVCFKCKNVEVELYRTHKHKSDSFDNRHGSHQETSMKFRLIRSKKEHCTNIIVEGQTDFLNFLLIISLRWSNGFRF